MGRTERDSEMLLSFHSDTIDAHALYSFERLLSGRKESNQTNFTAFIEFFKQHLPNFMPS